MQAPTNMHVYSTMYVEPTLHYYMEALTCETVRGGGHLPFHLPLLATLRGAGF